MQGPHASVQYDVGHAGQHASHLGTCQARATPRVTYTSTALLLQHQLPFYAFRPPRNPLHPSHQLQTIGFISYLWTNSSRDPGKYLVVAPLSTLGNWQREFARFCPDVPTVLYHGTDRAGIRATKMSGKGEEAGVGGELLVVREGQKVQGYCGVALG